MMKFMNIKNDFVLVIEISQPLSINEISSLGEGMTRLSSLVILLHKNAPKSSAADTSGRPCQFLLNMIAQ